MSLATLLEPRDNSDPSGPDLEYDSEFLALEKAAQTVGERQAGNEILPAEDPDFPAVQRHALAILERSHDLRAAVWLAQAKLRLEGFEGFADALEFIREMLDRWWGSCHPLLDADDDDDPTARINALLGLVDPDTTLRGVLLAPLAQSVTFGRTNLRDVLIASGEITPSDGAGVDPAAVAAALKDTDTALLSARLAALQKARQDLAGINKIFDEKTPGRGPDVTPLDRHLRRAVSRISEVLGGGEPAEADASAEETGAPAPAAARAPAAPGTIASTADVRAALDRIIAFYAEHEPSSPLPILLQRARRLIGADFLTIMRDVAPGGLDNVRSLGGLTDDD